MKISDVQLSVIKDSRGQDTLEAHIVGEGFDVKASVPSGKSTGEHEAAVVAPLVAAEKFSSLKKTLLSKDFASQKNFDDFLLELDGTENKTHLGGNTTLALSLSFARVMAKQQDIDLYAYIASLVAHQGEAAFPRPIFNVINGGAHVDVPEEWKDASGRLLRLDFQEFQIIPDTEDFALGLSLGKRCYEKLGMVLSDRFGEDSVRKGDEAGYFAPFLSNEDALETLWSLIDSSHYPLHIGIDAAATQFYTQKTYLLNGQTYTASQLHERYNALLHSYHLQSIEDPFFEEDFDSFVTLTRDAKKEDVLIITDDLTTTNPKWLAKAIEKRAGNAILVKPNQIGTLSETLEVVSMAHENGWKTIVSHRSGETEDDFIADLAAGVGAWGLKSGAPATLWRMNKYQRLLEIWQAQQN